MGGLSSEGGNLHGDGLQGRARGWRPQHRRPLASLCSREVHAKIGLVVQQRGSGAAVYDRAVQGARHEPTPCCTVWLVQFEHPRHGNLGFLPKKRCKRGKGKVREGCRGHLLAEQAGWTCGVLLGLPERWDLGRAAPVVMLASARPVALGAGVLPG